MLFSGLPKNVDELTRRIVHEAGPGGLCLSWALEETSNLLASQGLCSLQGSQSTTTLPHIDRNGLSYALPIC